MKAHYFAINTKYCHLSEYQKIKILYLLLLKLEVSFYSAL